MLFNSFQFVVFFPTILILYLLLPKKVKPVLLLLASYFFYMCWNPKYIVLILFTTIVTYACGLLVGKAGSDGKKKLWMWLCIISNLSVLFLFKYFSFFLDNINHALSVFGANPVESPFHFLLPVGISFYTFQAIGYVIDVYRGDIAAEKNPLDYALFVSFFPQLVAGPIERSKNLLPQIKEISKKNLFTYDGLVSGFGTMLWGFLLKTVIADRAAILVDHVFENYYRYGTIELVLAMMLFAVQIYADFAGYSAIAIGASRVMGIRLMENFETPYFATSVADFWNRWHISLSTWLKDYLYIPLGGNRKGKVRKYLNLLITFLVSGLWHGAAWHFVIWGLLHGIYRVVGEITTPLRDKIEDRLNVNKEVFSFRFTKIVLTFFFVNIAWVFFRAASLGDAVGFLKRMFTCFNPWALSDESIYNLGLDRREFGILIAGIILLVAVSVLRHYRKAEIGAFLSKQNFWFRWIVFIALIVAVLLFGEYGIEFSSAKFIYFDF